MSFAIPNGGSRNLITGKRLKMEGVTSGVPDCFIAIPIIHFETNGDSMAYSGLFIEFKVGKNTPTFNQRVFMKNLSENGYKCVVCYSLDAAINELKDYLGSLNGF